MTATFNLVYTFSLQQSTGQAVEVSQVERHHQVSPSPSPSPVVQHFVADRTPAIDKVSV